MLEKDIGHKISKRDASRATWLMRAGLIAGAGLGVLGIACGSEASAPGGQTEPQFTDTPTAESFTPTPEPTATLPPEATATEEPFDLLEVSAEVEGKVTSAIEGFPETQDLMNLKLALENGIEQINIAEGDPNYINSAINNLGDAAQKLAGITCQNPQSVELAESWLSLREFVHSYVIQKNQAGLFPGSLETVMNIWFRVPYGCENPYMIVDQ